MDGTAQRVLSSCSDVPIQVLYVGGLGRSGSTLFERMVGEFPQACALGEVVHLWQRGILDDDLCGCGESFSRCTFWGEVGRRAFGGWQSLDVDAVLSLKRRVDRNRHIPRLTSPLLSRRLRRDIQAYVGLYERLYAAALEVSGAEFVVDSSKHASLAYCLRRSLKIDLRVLHVVRDSPGVAYSWGRVVARPETGERGISMPRFGPWAVSIRWTSYNLLFDLLKVLRTPTMLVRYEDVVARPRAVMQRVGHFAQSASLRVPQSVADGAVQLSLTHTVAGNPMRFRVGQVNLRTDDAWRSGLTRRSRVTVLALTAPMRWRYRYGRVTARRRAAMSRRGEAR